MSSQDVEIVQRAHDALNRGDMDALVGLCDAGFRLDMSDRIFNPAVYEGHEGIRRFYSEVRDVWASYVWQPEEIIEAGENIVALLRSTGRGRGSGVEVERDTAMLWSLSGGRAVAVRFFREQDKALRTAAISRADSAGSPDLTGNELVQRCVGTSESADRVRALLKVDPDAPPAKRNEDGPGEEPEPLKDQGDPLSDQLHSAEALSLWPPQKWRAVFVEHNGVESTGLDRWRGPSCLMPF